MSGNESIIGTLDAVGTQNQPHIKTAHERRQYNFVVNHLVWTLHLL